MGKITAIKPIYRGKNRGYEIEVIHDACGSEVHYGYFVFDEDIAGSIRRIEEGTLLGHWPKAKQLAALGWLREQLTVPTGS
jgi:hypothetical protein